MIAAARKDQLGDLETSSEHQPESRDLTMQLICSEAHARSWLAGSKSKTENLVNIGWTEGVHGITRQASKLTMILISVYARRKFTDDNGWRSVSATSIFPIPLMGAGLRQAPIPFASDHLA